jgi:multidrug efflux pump subunit AcrB
MALFLTKSEERGIPAADITAAWRSKVGEVPGVESIVFKSNLVRMGANIDIQLSHERFEVLAEAAERIKQELAGYPGVGDIEDSYSIGKQEMKIRLKPDARTLGITEEDLGRQIRGAFYGAEALRLQRGRNEVKVMVRYPEQDRRSLWDLETMRIRTPAGGEMPLGRAARVEEGRGYSEIKRTDRKRVINVTASVESKTANAQEILDKLRRGMLTELRHDYPGLDFNLEGEEKERRESIASMAGGFQLALFAIFALLAIPFRSYSQPLIIMAAIPFGIVGAIGGHLIMGYNLSILSIFGIVALSGVVVNDSLLLIDRINQNRREGGEDLQQAVTDAGQRRFRPILLTSLTTFFGLTPMILERSVQAQFLIPMAISLGFGILFATGITLVLIPALYMALEDIRGLFGLRPDHADHGGG